jgi:outer membrane protein, heavy metal efflux system
MLRSSTKIAVTLLCLTPSLPAQTPPLPGNMTLQQAEDLLVQRSLPMLAAKYQIDAAEAARRVAGLRSNPTLEISAQQVPFYSNLPKAVPNFSRTNSDAAAMPTYGLQLGQLFERGDKPRLRSEQAQFTLAAVQAQSLDVIREQLLSLRQAFTAALLAQANLKLAEETDQQYAETERLMTIRLRGGEIAEVDLDRVKAARLPYLQAVLEAKLAYSQASKQVATLLGATNASLAGRTLVLAGELERDTTLPPIAELLTMAATERPDLKSVQSQVLAAGRATQLAEAQRKRDIYGSVQMQRVGQDYSLGASVAVPLFWHNNQRDAIAQAVAGERVAATQAKQAALQVEGDVERAYEAVQVARQALDLYSKEELDRSRSIRSIITYSYQRGEADLLEVLDAQRSANQILTSYNQTRANLMNAIWTLQYAVGRSF